MNTALPDEIRIGADKVMDVRRVPCSIKHGAIVRTFQALAVDDYFILLNDHDPARLRDQFTTQWPDTFAWEYLAKGPEDFQVKITKLKPLATTSAPAVFECGGR